MIVRVRLFGALAAHLPPGTPGKQARVTLPDAASMMDLLAALRIPHEVADGILAVAVNDEVAPLDTVLREGDVVSIFPPLTGG